jgi:hypothetical protein
MANQISNVPNRTPMLDSAGNLTRTWLLYFQTLADSGTEGYSVVVVDGSDTATPDLAQGINQEVVLDRPLTTIAGPINSPGPLTWTLVLVQDATGDRGVVFDSGSFVAASSLPGMLNTTLSTYSSLDFVIRADGQNALSNIATGLPLS